MPHSRKLLVEGDGDSRFFRTLCKQHGIDADIVVTPKESGADKDGKAGIYNALKICLNQLESGRIYQLGIILDADVPPDDSAQKVLTKIESTIKDRGFGSHNPLPGGGLLFSHNDGFQPLGAWIMPSHDRDGIFEHWLKDALSAEQQTLRSYAERVVKDLPDTRFNESLHTIKAEMASFLAWQKKPGAGAEHLLHANLLDANALTSLTAWLKAVFA